MSKLPSQNIKSYSGETFTLIATLKTAKNPLRDLWCYSHRCIFFTLTVHIYVYKRPVSADGFRIKPWWQSRFVLKVKLTTHPLFTIRTTRPRGGKCCFKSDYWQPYIIFVKLAADDVLPALGEEGSDLWGQILRKGTRNKWLLIFFFFFAQQVSHCGVFLEFNEIIYEGPSKSFLFVKK